MSRAEITRNSAPPRHHHEQRRGVRGAIAVQRLRRIQDVAGIVRNPIQSLGCRSTFHQGRWPQYSLGLSVQAQTWFAHCERLFLGFRNSQRMAAPNFNQCGVRDGVVEARRFDDGSRLAIALRHHGEQVSSGMCQSMIASGGRPMRKPAKRRASRWYLDELDSSLDS